jgi:hypothetical protein
MKINRALRAALLLLFAGVLGLGSVGGTLAKYKSSVEGSRFRTRIGAYRILTQNGTGNWVDISSGGNMLNINLNSTILDTADWDQTDTDVVQGKMAPGTHGAFAIQLKNLSEVRVKYTISIGTVTAGNGFALYWSLIGTSNATDWTVDFSELNLAESNSAGELAPLNGATDPTESMVYWKWDYSGNDPVDSNDTTAGIAERDNDGSTASISASVTLHVEQVN